MPCLKTKESVHPKKENKQFYCDVNCLQRDLWVIQCNVDSVSRKRERGVEV